MTGERLREALERRAPGQWELYFKSADSRELSSSGTGRGEIWRREEGWAARWWQDGSPRFACASTEESLVAALANSRPIVTSGEPPPSWPSGVHGPGHEPLNPAQAPPDLFGELHRLVSAESRGEALLATLTLRRGSSVEGIWNGKGLDVSLAAKVFDGYALSVGRRSSRACEASVLFRWEEGPDLASLARRLADRATLPLSERATPIERGELLLDPSVGAALLAALAPILTAGRPLPQWIHRAELFSAPVTIVDDARADAPCDGEGTPTRRVAVVEAGALRERLCDLRTAAGATPTGHGVRPSYRTPPSPAPRRLFFETAAGAAPSELLSSVRRGLFASALTAPPRLDAEADRYELEFTGVALIAGRAQGPVAGARSRGRLSQLLRRIRAVSTDRQYFPMPYPVGAPTLLIERAEFE